MKSPLDIATAAMLVFVVLLLAFGFVVSLAMKISDFYKELQYLKREIGRTEGAERQYWLREKRRLWMSLIPFCRR